MLNLKHFVQKFLTRNKMNLAMKHNNNVLFRFLKKWQQHLLVDIFQEFNKLIWLSVMVKPIEEALTIRGDSNTPSAECCEQHYDFCFWFFTAVNLNLEGQRFWSDNPTTRNNNIRYFLYRTFIDEQYCYLHGPTERQIGLPHLPLPFCLEADIKQLYPNENNRPFVVAPANHWIGPYLKIFV